MSIFIQRFIAYSRSHKIVASIVVIGLVSVIYGGSKIFGDSTAQAQYILAKVELGTVVVSVEGSGQVVASDQVDIKPKTSGDVTYVAVKAGQEVRTGAFLVQLDTSTAAKAVRDAQIALESAEITLAKLRINQQSNIPELQDDITKAENDLAQAYQNGYNKVADTFLTTPDILAGLRGILYDYTVGSPNQQNSGAYQDLVDRSTTSTVYTMVNRAMTDFTFAEQLHIKSLSAYQGSAINDSPDQIFSLMDSMFQTARAMVQAARDEQNILDTVESNLRQQGRPVPKTITQYQTDLGSNISALNSIISGVTSIQNTIDSSKRAITMAQRSLIEAQMSNPLDLKSQENTVEQRRAALTDAQTALANCSVRAPFGGIVTSVSVKRGDSSSTGTTIATLVTKQRVAEISLNEVDVANIKVGQKVTLTFDAIENLTMTGTVAEVDTVGAVSQGVVSYGVKISFDTQNDSIKPGMSVSAAIVTAVKQNVLTIPGTAVKTSNGSSYVLVPLDKQAAETSFQNATITTAGIALATAPQRQTVEIGLANDSVTEVISGLSEGDIVVTRTITSSSSNTTQTQSSQNRDLPRAGGFMMQMR